MRIGSFEIGRQNHNSVDTAVHGVLRCGDGVTKVNRRGLRNDRRAAPDMLNSKLDQVTFFVGAKIGEFARAPARENDVDSSFQHAIDMGQVAGLVYLVRVIFKNSTDRHTNAA